MLLTEKHAECTSIGSRGVESLPPTDPQLIPINGRKLTYDAAGRVTQILHRDADGANGEDLQDKRIDFTYTDINQWDRITRYENTNGSLNELVAQTRYGCDSGHRLTSITQDEALTGTTTDDIAVYTWGWDTASRIDSFTATNKTEADESIDYNYDATNQLIEEDYTTGTDNNWEYDANGNRTNTGYSTGTNNRLLSDGTYNYTYDDEGNRTRTTTIATGEYVEYSFDHRNRLTGAKFYDSSDVLQSELIYTYDATDRLIQREHDTDADSTIEETEAYVFDAAGKRDGVTTVPLDDIIAVFDETGSLTTRYLHGPGIDQILAEETLNSDGTVDEVTWALTDHLGTVRDLVTFDHSDGSTNIGTHRKYDAFGNITFSSKDFRYAFTGRYYDTDINLQWNRGRWFDGQTARWVSEDPMGFAAGDVNLMRYVGNGPTTQNDPSGYQGTGMGHSYEQYYRSQQLAADNARERKYQETRSELQEIFKWADSVGDTKNLRQTVAALIRFAWHVHEMRAGTWIEAVRSHPDDASGACEWFKYRFFKGLREHFTEQARDRFSYPAGHGASEEIYFRFKGENLKAEWLKAGDFTVSISSVTWGVHPNMKVSATEHTAVMVTITKTSDGAHQGEYRTIYFDAGSYASKYVNLGGRNNIFTQDVVDDMLRKGLFIGRLEAERVWEMHYRIRSELYMLHERQHDYLIGCP